MSDDNLELVLPEEDPDEFDGVLWSELPLDEVIAEVDRLASKLGVEQQPYKVYFAKEKILRETYPEGKVSPRDFYFDIFNEGEHLQEADSSNDGKGNVIMIRQSKQTGVVRRQYLYYKNRFEGLEDIAPDEFAIISPISYFGKARTLANARFMYALALDLDGVDGDKLNDLIYQYQNGIIPHPTYIVNSGNGLHLYYHFETPIPMRPGFRDLLKEIKRELVDLIWNPHTSNINKKQYQSINQGFRVVGTITKAMLEAGDNFQMVCSVTAYKTGDKVTLDYLSGFTSINPEQAVDSGRVSLEEAAERWPEWYQSRIVRGETPNQWAVSRKMYEWWINKIQGKILDKDGNRIGQASFGHRYWCIYTLAAVARKCGKYSEKTNPNPVTKEELEKDARSLLGFLNSLSREPFTEADMNAALRVYDDPLLCVKLSKTFLEEQTAIPMPPSHPHKPKDRRQKREWHLEDMRAKKERMKKRGQPFRNPEGRPSKESVVREWRENHPDGSKADCIRDTGLTRPTVSKWWD
ncbi:MAG: hypothetical protein IJI87_09215 [Mogibacterium sp.]|nr:hypothetical protein [Mogibacterium sp.]